MNTNRPLWKNPWLIAFVVVAALALSTLMWPSSGPAPAKSNLSTVLSKAAHGDIASAQIDDAANRLVVTETKQAGGRKMVASYPFAYGDELTTALLNDKVKVLTSPAASGSTLTDALIRLLPVLFILGFLLYVTKSGALTGGVGKFKGKRGQQLGDVPSARFADVAGCDEAIEELKEMVEFLKDDERFVRVGAKAPRGALLVGPPGTGKTLLARAVAGEAGVPFFALAGSDFVETFVGVGAKRARDLFDRARLAGKAIVFIDEIDSVGRARGGNGPSQGGEGERENTLVSLLNEMDGFDQSNVIVLAATNRPDVLDPALTRPGRLDRQVQVPNPDRRGRTAILEVHCQSRPMGEDVDLVSIARQTPGMSGADLAQVVNEGCMEAARRGLDIVSQECLQSAIATVAMGRARTSALVTEHDREVTAWHEAGHTVAALVQPDADDPVSVTIVPRGAAGGVTWMSGNDDIFMTRNKALAKLTTALAGRAAEETLMAGEFTQGASGDLQAATNLARAMVTQWGMTDFGYTQIDEDTLRMGGELAVAAHGHIETLLSQAHTRAHAILQTHRDLLEAVAMALLSEETLSAERVREIQQALTA
jgi:cell division protease FtsH